MCSIQHTFMTISFVMNKNEIGKYLKSYKRRSKIVVSIGYFSIISIIQANCNTNHKIC